jgi:hypothetical protein
VTVEQNEWEHNSGMRHKLIGRMLEITWLSVMLMGEQVQRGLENPKRWF